MYPNWRLVTVDELKSKEPRSCAAGPFGSSISAKYFVDQGVPVIRGGNLSDAGIRFIPEDFVFITEDKADTFKGAQVKAGDLVFTCWGTLGQVGLVPANGPFDVYVISNKQLKLRPDPETCSSEFLFYYFSTEHLKRHFQDIAIGSAVPGINLGLLKRIKLWLPPLQVQRKIAAILTAYDDLIENNKRRIALLQKMAEEIYREWFVRLRFPGHATTAVHKGVPDGWSIKEVGALCSEMRRRVTKRQLAMESCYVGLEHIPRRSLFLEQTGSTDDVVSDKFRFEAGDILFGKIRPYLHKVAMAASHGVCSSDTIVLRAREKHYRTFVLLTVSSDSFIDLATCAATGTKMPRADWGFLSRQALTVPADEILLNFEVRVEPMMQLAHQLIDMNSKLRAARDLLLGRLISGKLRVDELDIQFPPSMQ